MAQENIHMIKSITQANDDWRIQGKITYSVEQFWEEKESTPTNIDFIITDTEGTEIQATISNKLIFKFKALAIEGEYRFLTNFKVNKNIGDYRTTKHAYKIALTPKTIFTPTNPLVIPDKPMKFASFNDISLNNIDTIYLTDIIVELQAKGPMEKTSKDKNFMLIELIDCEGQKLIMTLWERLADQMATSTPEFDKSDHHPIVIIRYAKIKTFKESSVSTSLSSKILLDAEIPEVCSFIKRGEVGLKSSTRSTTTLTSYSESVANELLDISARRTIDEIREIQEGYFVTLATITAIDDEFKWYIESCKKCRATVELDDKEKWICTGKCGGYAKYVILRYKARVKVADHTGNATFIIFDTQADKKNTRKNKIRRVAAETI